MKSRFGIRTLALLLVACPLACSAAPPTASPAGLAAMQEQLENSRTNPAAAAAELKNGGDLSTMLQLMKTVEADPAQLASALKQGATLADLCANCHGHNGYSAQEDTPNLAGQNPRYLLAQMQKFVDGRRRYWFMEGLLKAMTPKERVSAMLFYSRQTVPPRPATDTVLRAQGKIYVEKVCFRCHGANGHGSEEYARLAGQQPPYMMLALKRYRNNSDGMRNDPFMAEVTKLMTDADISAVATYLASLP